MKKLTFVLLIFLCNCASSRQTITQEQMMRKRERWVENNEKWVIISASLLLLSFGIYTFKHK